MITVGAMQGWQCPVCGRVLAPFMTQCPCMGNLPSTTTTSTNGTTITLDGKEIAESIQKYMRGEVTTCSSAVM